MVDEQLLLLRELRDHHDDDLALLDEEVLDKPFLGEVLDHLALDPVLNPLALVELLEGQALFIVEAVVLIPIPQVHISIGSVLVSNFIIVVDLVRFSASWKIKVMWVSKASYSQDIDSR